MAVELRVRSAPFGFAMAISLGIKAPLDYSVFSASAAALLLALYQTRIEEKFKAEKDQLQPKQLSIDLSRNRMKIFVSGATAIGRPLLKQLVAAEDGCRAWVIKKPSDR